MQNLLQIFPISFLEGEKDLKVCNLDIGVATNYKSYLNRVQLFVVSSLRVEIA